MIPSTAARYQSVQITTSSPGELLLAMYDGLFKFLHQARFALENDRRAQAGEAISRAHAIVSELMLALDARHAPELCENLEALYEFACWRLLQANLHRDPEGIAEVIRVLAPVRDAFQTVVRSNATSDRPAQTPHSVSELR